MRGFYYDKREACVNALIYTTLESPSYQRDTLYLHRIFIASLVQIIVPSLYVAR